MGALEAASVPTLLLGGLAADKLLSPKQPDPVAAPTIEKPTLMPDPIAQQSQERRKASIMASQQMGRASTILTPTTEKLGG
jgi:hypothetical protein